MAFPGRPRAHDPIADEIRKTINATTSPDEVIHLIEQGGVDVLDGEARTPLIRSACAGNKKLVAWLLSKSANVNHQDRNGWAALYFAVQEKHLDVVLYLLESGASIDCKDTYGNTPLWRATFDARGQYDLVKLLMARGANPNSKNNADRSPVDFAIQIKDSELLKILQRG